MGVVEEPQQEPEAAKSHDVGTSDGRVMEEESPSDVAINVKKKKIPVAKPAAKFQPFTLPQRRKVIFATTKK